MLDYNLCTESGSIDFNGKPLKVYTTTENIFSKQKGNRHIVPAHISKLRKSFDEEYLFTMLYVNKNGEVLDGQNRLEVLLEMGEAITFVVLPDYGLAQTKRYNETNKTWGTDSYMESYIELGNDTYKAYKAFKDKYGFEHGVCQMLLSHTYGGTNHTESFKRGAFLIKDFRLSAKYAEMLWDFKDYKHFGANRFVIAMVKFFETPGYNHKRMVYAMGAQSYKLNGTVRTVFEYKQELARMYNLGLRKSARIYVLTPEEISGS